MARKQRLVAPHCRWQEKMGPDEDFWQTACGQAWVFLEDGPAENGVKFCHHCGRPVKAVRRASR